MVRVLKIGGSILTDKIGEKGALPEEIERVAREVASRPRDLVLVHGAGSFGHIPARQVRPAAKIQPGGTEGDP